MRQNTFKTWDRLLSVVVFVISTAVYMLTMETSASPWDCSEFILTFRNLEVGHPPGAPFYMLVYNFFSQLFPSSSPDAPAIMANALSATLSGLTILLLFRTISHLILRTIAVRREGGAEALTLDESLVALGGAAVGSLLYAFSDTFWFSAVEAEVYSFSSFFTALVFYLMLKWEEMADHEGSDRWLIAIAYLMGLSVGVHLLNLLALPAMALLYYFKRYDSPSYKGGVVATLVSFGLIAVIMFGIVQGLPRVAGAIELVAVNTLHLPFNTGLALHIALLVATLVFTFVVTLRRPAPMLWVKVGFLASAVLMGIPFMGSGWVVPLLLMGALAFYLFRSQQLHLRTLNVLLVSMFVFFLGCSTYGLILVRANSDITMNQNTPSDVFSLRYYLSREQYGKTPLLYGPSYASVPEYGSDGRVKLKNNTVWKRQEKAQPTDPDRYVATDSPEVIYRSDMNMLFPRMYNNTMPHYPDGYRAWSNQEGRRVTYNDRGETKSVMLPTFGDNLYYFFVYQVNYMYWRYFLWNFSGRQNDLQGQGEITRGNWITGIPVLDSLFLGPQDEQPHFIAHNKAHNRYFMLPLILGIIGLLFQVGRGPKGKETFWITFSLFFMTGLAIVLYLNQPPAQVRERDYAYAGSFYTFAIWIGFAVPALYMWIKGKRESSPRAAVIATLLCLLVPTWVLAENYDDHDRSGRRLISDFGRNYLESCDENAVIFCNGDNDTFPLWYVQGVEGVRPDIRVCNTSYLQADWYIDQMKKNVYEGAPLPISWGHREYGGDRRSIAYIFPLVKEEIDMSTALAYASSDDPRHKRLPEIAQEVDHVPTQHLYIPYDAAKLIERGIMLPSDTALVGDSRARFDFSQKRYLGRQELIILNMLDQSKYERPFYYCITVGESERVGMTPNFRQTGMAYRVLPFRTQETGTEIDTEAMYRNVTQKFRWGGADRPGTYMDENSRRTCETYRSNVFAPLANALVAKGDTVRAREVLTLAKSAIREDVVPHSFSSLPLVAAYYNADDLDSAREISQQLITTSLQSLKWYNRLGTEAYINLLREVEELLLTVNELLRLDGLKGGELEALYGQEYQVSEEKYLALRKMIDAEPQE